MALIADMDLLDPDTNGTGHIDGTTLNIPMTKDVAGNDVPACTYGVVECFGTNGSISFQRIIGYEQKENVAPSTWERIDIGDGSGFSEWLNKG